VTERVGALGQVAAFVVLEEGGFARGVFDSLDAAEQVVEELDAAGDQGGVRVFAEVVGVEAVRVGVVAEAAEEFVGAAGAGVVGAALDFEEPAAGVVDEFLAAAVDGARGAAFELSE
jgi:hypothetical protein